MRERIGIFGGTFNPVHLGHLAMAQKAREQARLDQVVFVPCYLPPHKPMSGLAGARHRLAMVRRAVRGNPHFKVSSCEIARKGKSYSVHTAREFRRRYLKAKFFWIIGADSLRHLRSWKDIDELRKLVTFVAVNRPGYTALRSALPHLAVAMPGIDIASSYLRRELVRGKTVKYLVPESVIRYIEQHGLYR